MRLIVGREVGGRIWVQDKKLYNHAQYLLFLTRWRKVGGSSEGCYRLCRASGAGAGSEGPTETADCKSIKTARGQDFLGEIKKTGIYLSG